MSQSLDITNVSTPAPAEVDRSRPATQTPEQLKMLAAQFEAMLMGQMLKQMQSSMFGDDDDADAGFAKGPLADAMYSELSQALSRAGGVGLGDSMLAPLLRQAEQMGIATDASSDAMAMPMPMVTTPGVALPAPSSFSTPAFSLGKVSSAFGWRSDPLNGAMKFHKGMDIAMPVGQEVPVAQAGRVTFAGEQSGYGLTVMVEHRPGLVTRYAHLSELGVAAGDAVADGQTIGKSGASGRVTGAHLHFEVLEDGQPVDPTDRLARLGTAVQGTD